MDCREQREDNKVGRMSHRDNRHVFFKTLYVESQKEAPWSPHAGPTCTTFTRFNTGTLSSAASSVSPFTDWLWNSLHLKKETLAQSVFGLCCLCVFIHSAESEQAATFPTVQILGIISVVLVIISICHIGFALSILL